MWEQLDRRVSHAVFHSLARLGLPEILQGPSPITAGLPLINSPTPQALCAAAYLTVVLAGVTFLKQKGPGKHKEPLWLRALVQLHNVVLIALSSYMCSSAVYNAWMYGYSFWGTGYSPAEVNMGRTVYIFYISKLYEFMDTVIMILKGNLKQVSLLHVYHHVSISCIWWVIAYVAPGGDAWYSVFLNSLVHVFMYTYYLAAALLAGNKAAKARYLWWGRYLTMFQMFQFVTMMAQAAYTSRFSPYPAFLSRLLFWYMQTLLALFAHFFVRKYARGVGGSKPRAKQQATVNGGGKTAAINGGISAAAVNGGHSGVNGVNGMTGVKKE